jgi:hypothetical protein
VTVRLWWKTRAIVRRVFLALVHVNDPWDGGVVDLKSPAVRRMIARAIWADRRELRGVRIVRRYSRDPVVERREMSLESPSEKSERLTKAHRDRYPLRMAC